ncbi:MAG: hypothetical protein GY950_10135 [bacterium]|nr:hypothetical protein [bacterium]
MGHEHTIKVTNQLGGKRRIVIMLGDRKVGELGGKGGFVEFVLPAEFDLKLLVSGETLQPTTRIKLTPVNDCNLLVRQIGMEEREVAGWMIRFPESEEAIEPTKVNITIGDDKSGTDDED